MGREWLRFSVKQLLIVTLIVSAFLAGWYSQVERAQRAEKQTALAGAREEAAKSVRDFWRDVSKNSRDDLFTASDYAHVSWSMQTKGGGMSYVRPLYDDFLRPRCRRWAFKWASSTDETALQLDALKMKLVVVQRDLTSIVVLGDFSSPKVSVENYGAATVGVFMEADAVDMMLVRKAGYDPESVLVVKLLPKATESQLLSLEGDYAAEHGIDSYAKIQQTTFTFDTREGKISPKVAGTTPRKFP